MKLLRNREIRIQLALSLAVAVVLAAAVYVFRGRSAAALTALCGFSVCAIDAFFLYRRYFRLRTLSKEIDAVLHGQESIIKGQGSEGELAILTSEIQKMTVRLREQADSLTAEKLRLTDAISDMFHQMRTPITSMSIELSLLSDDESGPERRVELTRKLKKQLERLQWLTETLLKLSKIDAGADFRQDRVVVRTLINKASEPFAIPMELREQTFTVNAADEAFTGDLSWSCEAVGNLIKNCIEHTPAGGKICVDAVETAVYTQIVIRDSGEGFVSSDIPHLFERFYRGENSSEESLGIGLALSRAIIARQNGTITADNAPGGGARFTIKFYKSVV